jgi:heptosyltransferase-1
MRILFVKTSSLGDVIHHCPAVSDARLRFPDAAIDWVVEEAFAGIAQMHPAVRRVVPVGIRRWRTKLAHRRTWSEIAAFRRAIRSQAYDRVIDTQGLLKSALIASQANGATHGFDASSAREPLASRLYDVRHAVARDQHAVDRNRELSAAALGIHPDADCDYGLVAPARHPLSVGSRFCVLLSMTSRPDKLWGETRWAQLVRALAAGGLESVLPWGSEAEQARCRRIAGLAGSGIVPRLLSLGELASAMSASHAVVGVDTGLTHLAAALGVPAVGLFCGSDPRLTGLHGSGRISNLGHPGKEPAADEALAAMRALT